MPWTHFVLEAFCCKKDLEKLTNGINVNCEHEGFPIFEDCMRGLELCPFFMYESAPNDEVDVAVQAILNRKKKKE